MTGIAEVGLLLVVGGWFIGLLIGVAARVIGQRRS